MLKKLRVHIVPVGYEFDRIVMPLIEYKADRVYLITHTKGEDSAKDYVKNASTELKKKGITDIQIIHCKINDVYDIIHKIREITEQEKDNLVHINISSGNKRATIAGMLVAMMTENNIVPYYVEPEEYGTKSKGLKFLSSGVRKIEDIPTFKINLPNQDLIKTLKFIAKKAGEKKR